MSAGGVQFELHPLFSNRTCASRVRHANVPALDVNGPTPGERATNPVRNT